MKVFDILLPEFLMLYDPLIVAFERTKLIAAPCQGVMSATRSSLAVIACEIREMRISTSCKHFLRSERNHITAQS